MNTQSLASAVQAGHDLIAAGKIAEADQLSRQLLAARNDIPVLLLQAAVAESKSEFEEALAIVSAALQQHGEHPELLLKQAQYLMKLRRRRQGIEVAGRAAERFPTDAKLLLSLAQIHLQRDRPDVAKPLLLRARDLQPTDAAILYHLGTAHFYLNEMDEAAEQLEKVLRLAPANGFALFVRAQLRTQTKESNNLESLRNALMHPRLRQIDAISAYFALGKELEDVGEYAESFAALKEGNRLKRSTLSYDIRNDQRAMQNVAAHYTREALDKLSCGNPETGPIFIVGMPRTGTTLVERILGSHSEVIALGELTDFPAEMTDLARRAYREMNSTSQDLLQASLKIDFSELGSNYLRSVREIDAEHKYTVDKLPFNFRYCGLIHKALPNAKILHLTRDPLDTCYAIFKTLFINAYHYSYQLDELADFYIAYRKMMAHWHDVLPGVMYDLQYEQLVTDPATECRKLFEWCGLPWEDDVLEYHQSRTASTTASAAQVRKPIYRSSVLKWRHFEKQLQPVVRRLAAAGLVDDAGNPSPVATHA
jgi:tetratricopeptide (TPR) repeat protein